MTIKDIAKLAGVSTATVSRVINNNGYVKREIRNKVNEIIHETKFVPNINARLLKSDLTKNIALMVSGINNPFFHNIIKIIDEKITLRGYNVIIHSFSGSGDIMEVAIKETLERNLCGVIFLGGSDYTEEKFNRINIPCVIVTTNAQGEAPDELYSSVGVDDEQAAFNAVEYLISMGHKNIGFFQEFVNIENSPMTLRYKGYLRALHTNGISINPSLIAKAIYNVENPYEAGFLKTMELMRNIPSMTAVFAYNDILAIGAAKAIDVMGYRIGKDVSVIGFDGIPQMEFFIPSLDTVYQPASEMAINAIELLFSLMAGNSGKHIILDTVILKKGSVGRV